MKTIAVMQPYFLPYWPYFQMLSAVDEWIVLDNVQFPARGFMTRNQILLNQAAHRFTLPVVKATQSALISEIHCHDLPDFSDKFLSLVHHAYSKAPEFDSVMSLLHAIFDFDGSNLLSFLMHSFDLLFAYLALSTNCVLASSIPIAADVRGSDRIIALCKARQASHYLNLPGGKALYNKNDFASEQIELAFVDNTPLPYRQFQTDFVPNLSVIDSLFFLDRATVQTRLACESQPA